MKSPIKWVGGKSKLVPLISSNAADLGSIVEPFCGSAALTLSNEPEVAVLNDSNEELINFYRVVRDDPEILIALAGILEYDKRMYYAVRRTTQDWAPAQAARFLYLNRTGFNGLYRVNNKGGFNVPFGKYNNPRIVFEGRIRSLSDYLNKDSVILSSVDFEEVFIPDGSVVYCDPPYHKVFTKYTKRDFDEPNQERLESWASRLKCSVIVSNSDNPFIRRLYRNWRILGVDTNTQVGGSCKKQRELLMMNY